MKFFSTYIGPYPFEKLANVQSTTIFGGRALRSLARGEVDWRVLCGETIGLEQLPEALSAPSGGRARKWVVDPRL